MMMKNKWYKQPKGPRLSKSFSSFRKEIQYSPNLNMFLQDIQLGIMPIGGESDRAPKFAVEIRGGPSDKPHVLAILESLTRRYQHNWHSQPPLDELLIDAVKAIVLELVWEGRSVHKIFWDEKNDGVYRLHAFAYQWLFRVFGRYTRILPEAHWHPDENIYDVSTETDIWDIMMPKKLGGYQGHRAMLKKLARCPDIVPAILKNTVSLHEWPKHFNAKHYAQEVKLYVARATKRWGWNQRDYNSENWNEFYGMYRSVTLKWAQACLREHIIKELNQLFLRLQIDAEIVVGGLLTAWEILRIRKQMCEGKISFIKAYEKCLV